MLPTENRLSSFRIIELVKLQGKKQRFGSLLLITKKQANGDSPTKFAIVISKKVSLKAVQRNSLKRLIRAELRASLPGLTSGNLCVLIATPQALKVSKAEVIGDLGKVLASLK